jgi:hypothetical protein
VRTTSKALKEDTVQYAVLIYLKPDSYDGLSDAERRQITDEYLRIREQPGYAGGAQLQPVETATTVRVQDGETLFTDGPFANTKEVFGGYYLFEADDLDAVLQIAATIPAVRMGGAVEVRPLMEPVS